MHRQELAVCAFDIQPPTRKFLLLLIASRADESGRGAWPAVTTTIATLVGIKPRQAMEHVAALRRDGYLLETDRRPVPGGREVVEYSVAMDEETRQAWAATHAVERMCAPERIRPTSQNQVQELRSCTAAGGGGVTTPTCQEVHVSEMDDAGYRNPLAPPPGRQARAGRAGRQGADDGLTGADAAQEAMRTIPGPQNGTQGLKAVSDEFRRRVREINPVLQHNGQVFMTIAGKRRREQGLSVETVAAMADLFFTDPSYMARAKDHPYRYFFQKWAELHERVQRSEPADAAVYSDDARTDEFERRLLGLD